MKELRELDGRIVFDYGGCSIVTETATVMAYIGHMVRSVREKAKQMGLTRAFPAPLFVFRMSRRLWEGICDLYVCTIPDSIESVPTVALERPRVELKAEQSIFVDGTRYSVELDEAAGNDIFFMLQDDVPPIEGAVLENVAPEERYKVGRRQDAGNKT